MRLKNLYAELGELIGQGLGRKQVCIDKATFHHNCENDGVTILDVESVEIQWVPLSDDDGGVAAADRLGKILKVPKYADGSGYDFMKFRTAKPGAEQ